MKAKTLGKQIRAERRRLDLTGRELARRINVSAAYLCDIELDRRTPSPAVLKRLQRHVDVRFQCPHAPCRRCGEEWPLWT